ncbi:uncharacterized protein LOC110857330 [Folsomia candida]|uniref:Uncharacterized protein n=1 Tax=Folsomia candida TaxID=158441 RepID=A0A226DJP2_FOLCA|nr:uncharacterized protein LOC110857330 [Folsomia candida]OXA44917.1 hypothetical protein Fcan01_20010 [Folsomia candida]
MSKLYIIVLAIVTTVHCTTKITMWEEPKYEGRSGYFPDLDGYIYGTLGPFDNRMSSFKIDIGSCVEAFNDDPPGGEWFWTDTRNYASFPVKSGMDKRISSMRSCGRSIVDLKCPAGTFVKRIEWDKVHKLKDGLKLKLHCMSFQSTSAAIVLYVTPANLKATETRDCFTAVRGIRFTRQANLEVDTDIDPDCMPGMTEEKSAYCTDGNAMVGVRLEVESHTKLIKQSRIYCSRWTHSNNGHEIELVEPFYLRDKEKSENVEPDKVATVVIP